jgi:hypothetical protein
MKKSIVILVLFCLFFNGFSQLDTAKRNTLFIYGSTGLYFLSNNLITDAYNSNSGFIYSFGIKFGDTDNKIHSFMEYSAIEFNDSMFVGTTITNVKLKQSFIKAGLIDYIPIRKDTYFRVKAGITWVMTQEDFYKIDNQGAGFYVAFGLERKLNDEFYYFMDIGYDYRKIEESRLYGDYGGFRVELGLYLNLLIPGAEE